MSFLHKKLLTIYNFKLSLIQSGVMSQHGDIVDRLEYLIKRLKENNCSPKSSEGKSRKKSKCFKDEDSLIIRRSSITPPSRRKYKYKPLCNTRNYPKSAKKEVSPLSPKIKKQGTRQIKLTVLEPNRQEINLRKNVKTISPKMYNQKKSNKPHKHDNATQVNNSLSMDSSEIIEIFEDYFSNYKTSSFQSVERVIKDIYFQKWLKLYKLRNSLHIRNTLMKIKANSKYQLMMLDKPGLIVDDNSSDISYNKNLVKIGKEYKPNRYIPNLESSYTSSLISEKTEVNTRVLPAEFIPTKIIPESRSESSDLSFNFKKSRRDFESESQYSVNSEMRSKGNSTHDQTSASGSVRNYPDYVDSVGLPDDATDGRQADSFFKSDNASNKSDVQSVGSYSSQWTAKSAQQNNAKQNEKKSKANENESDGFIFEQQAVSSNTNVATKNNKVNWFGNSADPELYTISSGDKSRVLGYKDEMASSERSDHPESFGLSLEPEITSPVVTELIRNEPQRIHKLPTKRVTNFLFGDSLNDDLDEESDIKMSVSEILKRNKFSIGDTGTISYKTQYAPNIKTGSNFAVGTTESINTNRQSESFVLEIYDNCNSLNDGSKASDRVDDTNYSFNISLSKSAIHPIGQNPNNTCHYDIDNEGFDDLNRTKHIPDTNKSFESFVIEVADNQSMQSLDVSLGQNSKTPVISNVSNATEDIQISLNFDDDCNYGTDEKNKTNDDKDELASDSDE